MSHIQKLATLATALFFATALAARAQYQGLVISEVITNPTEDEMIEITNTSAAAMDVSGVVVSDEETGGSEGAAAFPASTVLAAGETVVVVVGVSNVEPTWFDSLPAGVRVFSEPARITGPWTPANGNSITPLVNVATPTGNLSLSATDNATLFQPTVTFSATGYSDAALCIDGVNWDTSGPYGPINSTGQLDTSATELQGDHRADYSYQRSHSAPSAGSWRSFVQDLKTPGTFPVSNAARIRNTDWYTREIGAGAYIKSRRFDGLFNSSQVIHFVEYDDTLPGTSMRLAYRHDGTARTVQQYAEETTGAAAAVNGNFFNTQTLYTVQFLRVDGTDITPTVGSAADEGGVVVDAGGDAFPTVRPAAGWASLTEPGIMATNTPLVSAKKIYGFSATDPFYVTDRHPRTAVGRTPEGKVILLLVDGRSGIAAGMTLHELARTLIALGASSAVNMDGGGSSAIWDRDLTGTGISNIPSDGTQRRVVNALVACFPPSAAPRPAYVAQRAGNAVHASPYTPLTLNTTSGASASVTLSFINKGTATWTPDTVLLATSEPFDHASSFHDPSDWISPSRATALNEASVAPGAIGSFTFRVPVPVVDVTTLFEESFSLVTSGGQFFGPPQTRVTLAVAPPLSGETVVESRQPDGAVTAAPAYQETGAFSNTTAKSKPPAPLLSAPGARYNFTIGSTATFRPTLPQDGTYNVYVTLGAGSNNNAASSFVIGSDGTTAASGSVALIYTDATLVDQWKLLASDVPLTKDASPYITFTNVDGNGASGKRFVMDAVRFSLTSPPDPSPDLWLLH